MPPPANDGWRGSWKTRPCGLSEPPRCWRGRAPRSATSRFLPAADSVRRRAVGNCPAQSPLAGPVVQRSTPHAARTSNRLASPSAPGGRRRRGATASTAPDALARTIASVAATSYAAAAARRSLAARMSATAGERLLGPAQRLADRLGPGVERLADLPPQRLAESGGQAGVVEGGQRLVDLRTRGGECADSRQGRAAGPAAAPRRGRGPGGSTGRWLPRCLGRGRAGQQSERLRRVHDPRPAGRGQVGQLPPGALLGGGDHAAAVRRAALRAAERVERPGVFFQRRGMDEQHGGLVVSPQQLHTHTVHFLSTIVLLFPQPSRSFHGRPALSAAGPGRFTGHRRNSAAVAVRGFEPRHSGAGVHGAGRDHRERTVRRAAGRGSACRRARSPPRVRRLPARRSRAAP